MKARIGGIVVLALALVRLAGGCGNIVVGLEDAGSDRPPVTSGAGGAVIVEGAGGARVVDAGRDLLADAPDDRPIVTGGAGATGAGGTGTGGTGVGGSGAGGSGAGGHGTGGSGAGGSGAGGQGTGGSGAGGSGAGGHGTGGSGVGGSGAGGHGTGGAGVGGHGTGGSGTGGSGVGGALGTGGAGTGGSGAGGHGTGGSGTGGSGVGGSGSGGSMSTRVDAGTATDAPGDAARVTLTQIWNTILKDVSTSTSPGCISCHDGGTASIPNYTSVATSFATLVGVPSTSCPPKIRVVAGNAETSILVNKLRAGSGFALSVLCGGDVMPRGNRRITLDQLHMIEAWVNAGASNN
jgi:hypothetical protein